MHPTLLIVSIASIPLALGAHAQESSKPESPAAVQDHRERDAEPLYLAAVKAAQSAGDLTNRTVQKPVLDAIEAALKAGACPTRTLTDAAFANLHTVARFRNLIRDHARQSEISMTVPGEPGDKMRVSGVVRDEAGKPVAGALVYAYHTDARGIYSEQGSDAPRIFGYMRTDAEGRFAFNSIRPASYPGRPNEFDQHIHYIVTAPGYQDRQTGSEFADDPYWEGKTLPETAVKVTKDDKGVAHCRFDMTLQRAR